MDGQPGLLATHGRRFLKLTTVRRAASVQQRDKAHHPLLLHRVMLLRDVSVRGRHAIQDGRRRSAAAESASAGRWQLWQGGATRFRRYEGRHQSLLQAIMLLRSVSMRGWYAVQDGRRRPAAGKSSSARRPQLWQRRATPCRSTNDTICRRYVAEACRRACRATDVDRFPMGVSILSAS